jgi:hypothetical protein
MPCTSHCWNQRTAFGQDTLEGANAAQTDGADKSLSEHLRSGANAQYRSVSCIPAGWTTGQSPKTCSKEDGLGPMRTRQVRSTRQAPPPVQRRYKQGGHLHALIDHFMFGGSNGNAMYENTTSAIPDQRVRVAYLKPFSGVFVWTSWHAGISL